MDEVERFRASALAADVRPATVARLVATARRCVTLGPQADGPRVGVAGGHPPLPAGDPGHDSTFVCAVDCALVPADAVGVAWPRDGHLLFFGDTYDRGQVRYLPPGAELTEREIPGVPVLTRRELRMSMDVSLAPLEWETDFDDDELDDVDELEETIAACAVGLHSGGPLQIGGYPAHWNDPPATDRVLLATWSGAENDFDLPFTILYWHITADDLAARRFDRAGQSHDSSA